jgi:zinc transporter, ZIP family
MLEAAWWGFFGGLALVGGALVALAFRIPLRVVALIMGFGAGVLISAVAFELTVEAAQRGGWDAVGLGLAAGALVFFFGDRWIDSMGGARRKSAAGGQSEGAALGLVLGAVLDGIPESLALGTPCSRATASAAHSSRRCSSRTCPRGSRRRRASGGGRSPRGIARMWLGIAVISGLAAAIGYGALDGAGDNLIAWIQAFAAGAILTMLSDTMVPEAHKSGGNVVGLLTVLGFALSAYLSSL